jgi:hypothetical protein
MFMRTLDHDLNHEAVKIVFSSSLVLTLACFFMRPPEGSASLRIGIIGGVASAIMMAFNAGVRAGRDYREAETITAFVAGAQAGKKHVERFDSAMIQRLRRMEKLIPTVWRELAQRDVQIKNLEAMLSPVNISSEGLFGAPNVQGNGDENERGYSSDPETSYRS